ncbi:nucleolar protein [Teratosphaeriaceae sp. CCFEE 6253]|nr:nucleolar protein [Teratosphaeriaceae sp. CCFEE 6253]
MSTQTATKKRKSTGDAVPATKKVKTAKAASKPAPLKSALKKPTSKGAAAAKPAKPTKKKVVEAAEPTLKDAVQLAEDAAAKPTPKDEVAAKKTKSSKMTKSKPVKAARQVAEDAAQVADQESSTVGDDIEGGMALTEDQTAALIAGFSSSEDEASDAEEDGVAIAKLPQVPSMGDIQARIKDATTENPERVPGVIYVGRIPHGFYEPQMRAYFSQFGIIQNMRLARNRKTGKSQHYAFVEFTSKAVAEIVAKTMDKYLLFGHIMQVRTVPREQVKENIWDGTGRRKKPAPRNRLEGGRLKRGMVREDWEKRIERESKKRVEKAEQLKEMGYEFDMPDVKSVSEVPVKPKTVEDGDAVDVDAAAPPSLEQEPIEQLATEEVASVETTGAATDILPSGPASDVVEDKAPKANKKRASIEGKTKKSKKMKV